MKRLLLQVAIVIAIIFGTFSASTTTPTLGQQPGPPVRDIRPCHGTIPEVAEKAVAARATGTRIERIDYDCLPTVRKRRPQFSNLAALGRAYSVVLATPVKPTGAAVITLPGVSTPLPFGKWVDLESPILPAQERSGAIYSFVKWKLKETITTGTAKCAGCDWLSKNTPTELGTVGAGEFVTRTLGGIANIPTPSGTIQVIQYNPDITPINFSIGGERESVYLLILAMDPTKPGVADMVYDGSSAYWVCPVCGNTLFPFEPTVQYPGTLLNQQTLAAVKAAFTTSTALPPRIPRQLSLPPNIKQDQGQNTHPQKGCDADYCWSDWHAQPHQHSSVAVPGEGRRAVVVGVKDLGTGPDATIMRGRLQAALDIMNSAMGVHGEEPWYYFVLNFGPDAEGQTVREPTDIVITSSAGMDDCAQFFYNTLPPKVVMPDTAAQQSARAVVDSFVHEIAGHFAGLADVKQNDENGDICRSTTNPGADESCEPAAGVTIGPTPLDVTLANANQDDARRGQECNRMRHPVTPAGGGNSATTTSQMREQYDLCSTLFLVTQYWVCWEGITSGCRLAGEDRQVISTTCLLD